MIKIEGRIINLQIEDSILREIESDIKLDFDWTAFIAEAEENPLGIADRLVETATYYYMLGHRDARHAASDLAYRGRTNNETK